MNEIVCGKCDCICCIDGEYPRFFAWCEECQDYAEGFDACDHAAEWMAGQIDAAMDREAYKDI